jgi:hypothetical protein
MLIKTALIYIILLNKEINYILWQVSRLLEYILLILLNGIKIKYFHLKFILNSIQSFQLSIFLNI